MRTVRDTASLALAATFIIGASVSAADDGVQTADRVDNQPTDAIEGATELLVAENARVERSADGLDIRIAIPTPASNGYAYPESIVDAMRAQPEAFTGWAFIFNHHENCVTEPGTPFPCGMMDFNADAQGGVYNFAGHVNSLSQHSGGELLLNVGTDGMLVLEGTVATGQDDHGAPPGNESFPLSNPMGAEVHVAIAPHGMIDPSQLPGELYRPVGTPACGCWWVATFAAPSA